MTPNERSDRQDPDEEDRLLDQPWGEQQAQVDWLESRFDSPEPPGFDEEYDRYDDIW